MSDGVLAAIIAAGATVFTSFIQLRLSVSKPATPTPASRRKSRISLAFMIAMLVGAGVAGFALAQWLHEYEREAQDALQRDQAGRIADLTRTRIELERARDASHAQVETEVLRRMGADGVAVVATAAPCAGVRAAPAAGNAEAPGSSAPQSGQAPALTQSAPASSACTEADAVPVKLCTTIPAAAKLTNVDLYLGGADAAGPWTAAAAGQEIDHARFAAAPEATQVSGSGQVCEGFTQWSAQPRAARMVVHFSL